MKKKQCLLMAGIFLFVMSGWAADAPIKFDAYHTPQQLNKALKDFAKSNSKIAVLHSIAVSPGGIPVNMIEIGPEVKSSKKRLPAVLVTANMEGKVPISSEAALFVINSLLEKPELYKDKTWYVLPMGNPDAAMNYFKKPLYLDGRNGRSHNDDMDDRTDEDGMDDLDKNGIITMMRVKDPQGKMIPVPGEPRLMKKADWTKGEKGMYKLYTEGIDNDGDGQYNEDGKGGVNIGINFPHLFKFFTKDGGKWALTEQESYNLVKFIYEHPEIAMVFTFGDTNFCMVPPQGGRKGSADFSKIKIPKHIGKFMNVDTERTYTMKEIMEIAKRFVPEGMEVTESMVASFFGLGAVVNPLPKDLKFYEELSKKYKEFLKENKLDGKRLEPAKAKDGSFELWAYYHLGLPSFSMDFWTLPEAEKKKKEGESEITAEKLEKMSNEEFLALGEEKVDAFLKANKAPKNVQAKMLINAVKGGMMTPKKMADLMKKMPKPKSEEGADPKEKAFLAYIDKELGGKGFVNWKAYNHPTLGQVEIGGIVPFVANTPPASKISQLLTGQVPWIFKLVEKSPRIKIVKTKVIDLGSGLYRVKAWVENTSFIPYNTAMGQRNERIPPIVLTFSGKGYKIIQGQKRSLVKSIGAHSTVKVEWLLKANVPVNLTLNADSPLVWKASKQIKLGR